EEHLDRSLDLLRGPPEAARRRTVAKLKASCPPRKTLGLQARADTGLSGQTSHSARIATSVTRSPWQSAAMRSRTLQASSAGGSRPLRRAAPDAAAEGRYVDDRVVPGVERDALGVAERQAVQGSPGPARVPALPEARLLAPFVDAEVDPIRPARVDGRAEAVVPLAGDP